MDNWLFRKVEVTSSGSRNQDLGFFPLGDAAMLPEQKSEKTMLYIH
jgi:hypothetical protein